MKESERNTPERSGKTSFPVVASLIMLKGKCMDRD